MKKVLISILIVLLLVLAYVAIFNGFSLGNIKILSVAQIIEANDELTADISEAKSLLNEDYTAAKDDLSESVTELLEAKEEYYDLAKTSTEGEITEATTIKRYKIEYLWTTIGNHATSQGVNLKMDVVTGDSGEAEVKNLEFKVTGQYIGIMEFIAAIEDDEDLGFTIEEFKMTKVDDTLTATFTVTDVRIEIETTTTSTSSSSSDSSETVDDTDDTNDTTEEETTEDTTEDTVE